MARIVYEQHDGRRQEVEVEDGVSLMEGALANGVSGIDGDCGGNCACATCHVYIEPGWRAATGERSEMEGAMLEFAEGVEPGSRLACQINASSALDGLVVRLPAAQH